MIDQVLIDRNDWFKLANDCEKAGSVATCRAIIKLTVGLSIDEQDRRRTWMDDAEGLASQVGRPN